MGHLFSGIKKAAESIASAGEQLINKMSKYDEIFKGDGIKKMSTKELTEVSTDLYQLLGEQEDMINEYIKTLRSKNTEINELNTTLANIKALKEQLETDVEALKKAEADKDTAITEKDGKITELEGAKVKLEETLKATKKELDELKPKYDALIAELAECKTLADGYKNRAERAEECVAMKSVQLNKRVYIAEGEGPVKRVLFHNANIDFYMYLVENFDEKWKNNDIGKYLWNIAVHFKNGAAMCFYSPTPITISPSDHGDLLYQIDWDGFLGAVRSSSDYEAHNIDRVSFNGITAKNYTIKFWKGGHGHWDGEVYPRNVVTHENACHWLSGTEGCNGFTGGHPNINQTLFMWKWMKEKVLTGQADPNAEPNYDKHHRPPHTITEAPEEGKIKDVEFKGYIHRGLQRGAPLGEKSFFGEWSMVHAAGGWSEGDGTYHKLNNSWYGFENDVDGMFAAFEAPFILRLEIRDVIDCNKLLKQDKESTEAPTEEPTEEPKESFCLSNKRATIVRTIVIAILVILAFVLLYMIFFKKCEPQPRAITVQAEPSNEYTYIPDQ